MAKFAAMLERSSERKWSACVVGEQTVLGTGATRDEAIEGLRRGIAGLIEYLKETWQPVPLMTTEVVSIEVAA